MLMSKAAYAKHRGVSRQTVYDWIAKGDIVMSGTKIDVEATERQRQGGEKRAMYDDIDMERKIIISPRASVITDESEDDALYTPFKATAEKAAEMVLILDDLYPPAETYAELQMRIHDASEALGLELRLIAADGNEEYVTGLEFYDAEQDYIACRFDSPFYELETLTFFRWLITKKQLGDLDNVTKAGLAALAEPFVYDVKAIYDERAGISDDEEP
ncbi:hypothetical protein [Serratia aquatilis]|uniref:Helix-turn-helix domain-containing protein n=1 Tax=Serratia aquatilis TaxID=1737515 RepID=A0ABV6EC49_9GAMM